MATVREYFLSIAAKLLNMQQYFKRLGRRGIDWLPALMEGHNG
jgi:hypothetical protein